ncbi:sulfatase [Snuella lapsa]|uniref:Sulfatase n=2 Tax=Snuella lapsa TaxID=870481 RepID=A0ABP6Y2Q1_9FLAO
MALLSVLVFACQSTEKKETVEKQNRPNILFCISDDATYKHLSAYGSEFVKTPAFDKIAGAGLLFSNAYTPNAKCAPSRSIIVTGRNSWQLEEAGNHWSYFPTKFKTFAETLVENGYHVGYTAKGLAPVVALTEAGDQRPVLGKKYNKIRTTPPAKGMSTIDYSANFSQFLKEKKAGEPFCFWYGGLEPHREYEYGSGISKGNKKLSDIKIVPAFWPDTEEVRNDMLDYAFEIEYFDFHLGKMIEALEQAGELENTLIVVTSDNGMPFPRVKGQAYEYSNHLPLAIMWKNGIKTPGRVIDDIVNFTDLAPTFLEVAEISEKSSGMQAIQGKSLTDILFSNQSGIVTPSRDHVLIGKERHDVGRPNDVGYPIRGIRKGDYLFVINFETSRWPAGNPITGYLNCDGGATKTRIINDRRNGVDTTLWQLSFGRRKRFELYNITKDPECITNLVDEEGYAEIASSLQSQLENELIEQGDPRMFGKGYLFDDYLYSHEKDRNFYERYINGENPTAGWVNETDFEKEDK